jgi:phenylalanyl-tRNA synthetase beta chain
MLREESILRTSMLPGLLRAIAFNQAHRNGDVSLFETGPVFLRPAQEQELPDQPERVSVAIGGGDATTAVGVVYELAEALRVADLAIATDTFPGAHPSRGARIRASGAEVGVVGEIDPDVLAAWDIEGRVGWIELDVDALVGAPRRSMQMQPVSRFPTSDIDLSFVVDDEIAAGDVEATLRAAGGELLVSVELFDVYRGGGVADGHRSLTFRLRFQAQDRTLTDAEVGVARQRCIDAVTTAHGAELRA